MTKSQSLQTTGQLTHFDWRVEADVHGRLALGTYLDGVMSTATTGVVDLLVQPLNRRFDERPELERRDEPMSVSDYLRCSVNGIEVYISITISFKVYETPEDYDSAKEALGTALAGVNVVLAGGILAVTGKDLTKKAAERELDDIFKMAGEDMPSGVIGVLVPDLGGNGRRFSGRSFGPDPDWHTSGRRRFDDA
jgi:hypothetical protein